MVDLMVDVKGMKSDVGRSVRVKLLNLLTLELGIHTLNGTHFSAGIGIGPLELSTSLHNWEKW